MSDWIDVKDQLPNKKVVLICQQKATDPEKYVFDIAEYSDILKMWYFHLQKCYTGMKSILKTYWMPMPEPPEATK